MSGEVERQGSVKVSESISRQCILTPPGRPLSLTRGLSSIRYTSETGRTCRRRGRNSIQDSRLGVRSRNYMGYEKYWSSRLRIRPYSIYDVASYTSISLNHDKSVNKRNAIYAAYSAQVFRASWLSRG